MLAAEINPSIYEATNAHEPDTGEFHRIGTNNDASNYIRPVSFAPIFRAMRRAVLSQELPCLYSHRARQVEILSRSGVFYDGPRQCGEAELDYDILISSDALVEANFDMPTGTCERRFNFQKQPDWTQSTVDVADLRKWMAERGRFPAFFFPQEQPESTAFLDVTHEHFSPELALAVAAWEALAKEQRFPRGPKQAIEEWISANSDAWLGKKDYNEPWVGHGFAYTKPHHIRFKDRVLS